MAKIPNDVDDIQTVADYLSKHYGYTITTIVGHSRGSIAGFRWMCTSIDAELIPISRQKKSNRFLVAMSNLDKLPCHFLLYTV